MTVDNAWHRSGLALCEPSRVLLAGRGVLLVLLFFLSLLPLSSRSFPSLATLLPDPLHQPCTAHATLARRFLDALPTRSAVRRRKCDGRPQAVIILTSLRGSP